MLNQVSTVYLQVIGSGGSGAPRSLYVFTDHRRYLFNCGEGTQRLASEHKIKLSQLEHIFITHKSWTNVGGLPGALLTLQENGVSNITLHGPPKIDSLYEQAKNFMHFTNLKISCQDYLENDGHFCDDALAVHAVPLKPQNKSEEQLMEEGHESESSEESVRESSNNLAFAFICEIAPKLGALLPKRCKELGVPPGPLMGELKQGKDVTLPCGKLVKASDVTKAPDSPSAFIVVELPSELYIPDLINSTAFTKYQKGEFKPTVVVHFSPLKVIHSTSYQEWLNQFPSETAHLYFNENSRNSGSESVHRMQYKLNKIYPDSFPLLHESEIDFTSAENLSNESKENFSLSQKKLRTDSSTNGSSLKSEVKRMDDSPNSESPNSELNHNYQASTCLTYHIRPSMGIDTSKIVSINPQSYIEECYEIEGFKQTLSEVMNRVKEVKESESRVKEVKESESCIKEVKESEYRIKKSESNEAGLYPNILFLGTGSCIPNKVRNTSGIAIRFSSDSCMILDCGEGTFGQLVRFMGLTATRDFLKQLTLIYISHLHADHHIGLIKILLERKIAFQQSSDVSHVPKIILVAPRGIRHYLMSYDVDFERVSNLFDLVSNATLLDPSGFGAISGLVADAYGYCNVEHIQTCFVKHCANAFGLLVTLKGGLKITYSGDSMPCDALVELGMNCDILIHEATMEDDLLEDAELKRHSTVSQALEIGRRMEARYIILTHFSQRYSKVPLIDHLPPNAFIAFDNMMVRLSDLPLLPLLYPAFLSVFSEDVEELKKKRIKTKAKKSK